MAGPGPVNAPEPEPGLGARARMLAGDTIRYSSMPTPATTPKVVPPTS